MDKLLGLARSLVIYHGRPFRTSQLMKLYEQFVRPGDLCFDVGSHVGSHLRALVALRAEVVAIEPQPVFYSFLKRVWGSREDVTVIRSAIGCEIGLGELLVSSRTPTVTTLSKRWVNKVREKQSFRRVFWDQTTQVPLTTLDHLIAQYGQPTFCKVDTEGFEFEALCGLSAPVQAISFEYMPGAIEIALACVKRLGQLGDYRFNFAEGESMRLRSSTWLADDEITAWLSRLPAEAGSGDIYARLN
jgi:FkbM family methyltransferase